MILAASGESTVEIISDPAQAVAALQPVRRKILENLDEPDSAAGLARKLGLPRQRLNHHLRELESRGLVTFVEERRKGNCIERLMRSKARRYMISPEAMGDLGADDPGSVKDRFSWTYLVNLLGKAVRDLGELRKGAERAGKRLATVSLHAEIRFANAERRNSFVEELSAEVSRLVSKYHDEKSADGRRFTFLVAGYSTVTKPRKVASSPERIQPRHEEERRER